MTIKAEVEVRECGLCKSKLTVYDFDDGRELAFDQSGIHYCFDVPAHSEVLVIED